VPELEAEDLLPDRKPCSPFLSQQGSGAETGIIAENTPFCGEGSVPVGAGKTGIQRDFVDFFVKFFFKKST
jgi:hypothetical protein